VVDTPRESITEDVNRVIRSGELEPESKCTDDLTFEGIIVFTRIRNLGKSEQILRSEGVLDFPQFVKLNQKGCTLMAKLMLVTAKGI
jgi:hypothetical protein